MYIYIGSISSLILIRLNVLDIFCLYIFLLILSNCRIDLMIFGGNWLINFPLFVISQVLSAQLWTIIRGWFGSFVLTFVGYLMPKLFSEKNSSGAI